MKRRNVMGIHQNYTTKKERSKLSFPLYLIFSLQETIIRFHYLLSQVNTFTVMFSVVQNLFLIIYCPNN